MKCAALALFLMACQASTQVAPPPSPSPVERGRSHARHWDRAAMAFADAAENPSASERDRQLAEHQLARSFHELGLRNAAAAVLASIAESPKHAAYLDSFAPLARLAVELPDAAQLGAVLAKYPESLRAAHLKALPEATRARLHHLIGRHLYDAGQYNEAIIELEHAGDDARADILVALCHVQLRKSVPAVAAFARAREHTKDNRLIELSVLLEARTFYSAAIRYEEARKMLVVERKKMTHAIQLWGVLDGTPTFATDGEWERAWGYYSMGELDLAHDDLKDALLEPGNYHPEAQLLEAHIFWAKGDKERARGVYRSVLDEYQPTRDALRELTKRSDGDGPYVALLEQATDRPKALPGPLRIVVTRALGSRELAGSLQYLRLVDRERARFAALPAELRRSAAGARALRALADAQHAAHHRAAERVHANLLYELAALDDVLLDSQEALDASKKR